MPAAVALMLALSSLHAIADDTPLILELVLNGHSTGQVGEFTRRDGALAATAAQLSTFGFKLPDSLRHSKKPIRLDSLPGVTAVLDMRGQRALVTARYATLQPVLLGPRSVTPSVPVSSSGTGVVLNYDMLGTAAQGAQPDGGLSLEGRLFSPLGVVSASGLASLGGSSTTPWRRLDTTYEYDEPGSVRVWRAGDILSGALTWTRSVRLFGAQVASDFTLRPDLVTTAIPVLVSSAAVPSTADILVNGVRAFSAAVQPGPFELRSLPTVTGAGDVAVAMKDSLGRQTLVTLPFYISPDLLTPGLANYSIEVGTVRQSYGQANDRYRNGAAIASLRYGLFDWLTPEAHAELGGALEDLGVGAAIRIGTLGVLNVAGAGSAARDAAQPAGSRVAGWMASLSASRQAARYSVSVSATAASPGFRDTAAINGAPYPRLLLDINLSRSLGRWGGVSLDYVAQRGGVQYIQTADGTFSAAGTGNTAIVTASYTTRLSQRWGLYADAFRDMSGTNAGVLIGVSFTPFGRISSSTEVSVDRTGPPEETFQASRPAIEPGDWGAAVADQEGASVSRRASAEYLGTWGHVTAGVAQSGGADAGQAEMRGALVLAGGGLMVSDTVNDAFAVVRTGDVPHVPVTFENRPVGRTDSSGRLLVPYLNSYQPNTLGVDATRLPPDVTLDSSTKIVRPARDAGVVVDFGGHRTEGALVRLQLGTGKSVPLGASATLPGAEPQPVGYDGEVYITGLKARNRLDVALPDGGHCIASFAFHAVPGTLPSIGPVPCRMSR